MCIRDSPETAIIVKIVGIFHRGMPAVVEGRHHHQVNAHLIPVAGRHLFQMSPFPCVEQPRAVEYTLLRNLFYNLVSRTVNYGRTGRHRYDRRSQKRQHNACLLYTSRCV